MNGWEKMFDGWNERYYDEPFMFACELTAIILGIIYQRKNRIGQFFICYTIIDVSMLIIMVYLEYFSAITNQEFQFSTYIINSISFLCELLAYFFFFQQMLQNRLIEKIIGVLRVVFIGLTFFHLLNLLFFHIQITGKGDTYYLGTIEFFFLIVPCLFYFAELFSNPSAKSLFKRPSFWITTGIFFYTFVSIPYYFIGPYLYISKYQFSTELIALLFSLPYGITFLFLSKAFLCKTELTT
jgi:hypothetical protein